MSYLNKHDAAYNKTVVALFAGGFTSFAVLYSIQPLLPEISEQFDVSAAAANLPLSLTTIMLGVFMIAASMLSDVIGRRPVMTASLFLTSVFALLTAISPTYSFLLIVRALAGISIAGFPSIAMTFITEEFSSKTTGAVMGLYISGTTLGGLLARVAAGVLTDWFSWHIALAIIGAICLLLSFWFWFNMPDAKQFTPQAPNPKNVLKAFGRHLLNPALICLFALAFLLTGSFDTLFNYISYPLMAPPYNVSQTFAGMIFLVFLAGTFSSAVMGDVADRIGKGKTMAPALSSCLAGHC